MKKKKDIISRFCPCALKSIDFSKKISVNIYEEVKTGNGTKEGISYFNVTQMKSVEMTTNKFFDLFFQKLTGHGKDKKKNKSLRGFKWHYPVCKNQRFAYNNVIKKCKEGEVGNNFLMYVMDWAESHPLKNIKMSSDQFWNCRKCQIFGIVEYSFLQNRFEGTSNFFFSEQKLEKKIENSIGDLEKLIKKRIEENPGIDVIHIFTDGCCNEFLTRKKFWRHDEICKKMETKHSLAFSRKSSWKKYM